MTGQNAHLSMYAKSPMQMETVRVDPDEMSDQRAS